MDLNTLTYKIRGAAFSVHSTLGPGLLESAYQVCLAHELADVGLMVRREVEIPLIYKGIEMPAGYRVDLLVEEKIILELKSVEKVLPIHTAQLLTYLRLSKIHLGLLMNFNVERMREGIQRFVI